MPLPATLEQRAIVAKIESLFSELDQGVAQLEAVRRQLGRYRQSVLKAAFEGRLTAAWRERRRREAEQAGRPPAHASGTAKDLLARIHAEREAAYQQRLAEWERAAADWEAAAGKARKTSKPPKKPRKPTKPKDPPPLTADELAELPTLPEGWVWVRFGVLPAEMCLGKMLDKAKNTGRPRPYLANINVRWLSFDLGDLSTMRLEDAELERFSVRPGDLVICEGGEPGRCAVWKQDGEPMVIQKALHRVRFTRSVLPELGAYYMLCGTQNAVFDRYYTGTTIRHLTGQALALVPFPLCSADEQAEIVNEIDSRLSVVDQIERTIAAALKQAESLRQSILKKSFEGRLLSETELAAVRADPAYEPADRLLERIKGERADTNDAAPARRGRPRKRSEANA